MHTAFEDRRTHTMRWKDRCVAEEQIWIRDIEGLPPGKYLKYGLSKS
jgi:hypothetical protein